MIIDLLHNKIVSDTITEGFKKSVTESLVPGLESIYGADMLGIQMYEDYLADEFLLDGVFYYPMTVIKADEHVTHWVAWNVTADKFTDLIPYSYTGEENIAFDLSPAVPIDFETAIISRSRYCEDGLIRINVHSAAPSPTFLAGKYSQTFIDEMARQLTVAISEVVSVEGLADSGLELQLEFAPATFMEHNSENVTYRRLLLTDGASAPRDFWVKWINHRSAAPFTISDHPMSDEVEFLVGEGVPQKIREREYRYLLRTNNDKYHNSVGKRNITEWRDLIKRAIKRGKLTRVLREIPLADEVILVNAALANAAGLSTADVVSAGAAYESDSVNLDLATELAKAAGLVVDTFIDEPEDDEVSFDEPTYEPSDVDQDLLDLINHNKELVGSRDEAEDESEEEMEVDVEIELDDETYEEEELIEDEAEEFEEISDDESCDEAEFDLEPVELDEVEAEEEIEAVAEDVATEDEEETSELEIIEEIEENTVIVPEKMVETEETSEYQKPEPDLAEIEERLREGLEAKIRLEYEKQARTSAENEMIELRRKHEQLLIENRRLEAQAKKEYEERRRISEQRKLENDRLRAEIETKVKAEAREKERLAEAARMAVEEKHRLERERLEAERRRIEDERRMAEDRAKAEAEARVEAERQLEAERIRRSSIPAEVVDEAAVAEENKYARYTYIAKTVKLLFRYSVDPNITVRIQEILAATLKHYDKSDLHIRVRATVPDSSSVVLEFLEFPKQEIELLYEIIKILGASGIGIAKAILEDPKK